MTRGVVYLDNNASTRCDPRVVEAMLPWLTEEYGNPSSAHHAFGKRAADACEEAREKVAALIGARRREIVFTSGATEADNLAIQGAMRAHPEGHLITGATEHHAVLDVARHLEKQGRGVAVLPVDGEGRITADRVSAALTPRTALVSLMAANNETGVLHPLREIGAVCRERGVIFHTDAAQLAGRLPLDVDECGVDLLSMSAHKIHGPKGVGALYVRRSPRAVRLEPLVFGGGQERGLRSGTLPVPLVVGFGVACELAREGMAAEAARLRTLRDRLQAEITGRLEGVRVNGHPEQRLPNTLNVSFEWVNGPAVLLGLRGLAVSSGAACAAADAGPSHVLLAMGLEEGLAQASLRFGLGRWTTEAEVDFAIEEVARAVTAARAGSPEEMMRRGVLART
jgi:cysteine desulfurase